MIASAAATLAAVSALALLAPHYAMAAAGVAFALLAVRFIWLVWREIE